MKILPSSHRLWLSFVFSTRPYAPTCVTELAPSSSSNKLLLFPLLGPMQKSGQQSKAPAVVPDSKYVAAQNLSPLKVLALHFTCGLGLFSAFWLAVNFYSINLIENPAETLLVVWAVEASVVVLVYSLLRQNPERCSYVKAIARGLLGLPAGAAVNALGAIVLGAPVTIPHFKKTVHWSLLMSVFTFVPAASVFGTSWIDWHRTLVHTKPVGSIDYMICFPAYGAVIGAWFGAWPMPLDWERPWQKWPISVTYGAIIGHFVGTAVSFGFVVFHNLRPQLKRD